MHVEPSRSQWNPFAVVHVTLGKSKLGVNIESFSKTEQQDASEHRWSFGAGLLLPARGPGSGEDAAAGGSCLGSLFFGSRSRSLVFFNAWMSRSTLGRGWHFHELKTEVVKQLFSTVVKVFDVLEVVISALPQCKTFSKRNQKEEGF